MKAHRSIFLALCSVFALSLAGSATLAQASPPSPCDGGRDERAYNAGLVAGANLVQQAWNGIRNDCAVLQQFKDTVVEDIARLTLPARASTYTACRYAGTIDGVYEQLNQLWGTCERQCFLDGQVAGKISGEAYCVLSIALGGLASAEEFLRGPVQTCGDDFKDGCEYQFVFTSKSYTSAVGVCEPYTVAPFTDVWNQVRSRQCR